MRDLPSGGDAGRLAVGPRAAAGHRGLLERHDQAWVKQKNGAVVRRLVGYGRLEGVAGAEALARLYSAARLFVNVFQPSFKLAENRYHDAAGA